MNHLQMYLPITKVDAVNHLVYGVATEERPDRAREILDYAKSKPYYEKWSQEIAEATNGKSLGNVRAMHSRNAVGKLTELHFNDSQKRIEVCAKIVDDNEWNKVVEGVYTGFSQGGEYVERWPDPVDPSLKRYVANPTELSLVDLPCLPTATFQLIKSVGAVSEVEVHSFQSMSNEAGIESAFKKFFDPSKGFWAQIAEEEQGDPGAAEKAGMPPKVEAMLEAKEKAKEGDDDDKEDKADKGDDEDSEDDAKKAHMPGHVGDVPRGEKPSDGESHMGHPSDRGRRGGGTPHKPKIDAGGGEHPDTDMKETGEGNEEVDGHAHTHEPKTKEGIGQSQEQVDHQLPNSVQETPHHSAGGGQKATDAGDLKKEAPAALASLKQVWLASDGKPFDKKADALAYNKELELQAMAKDIADPADKAIAELQAALDRVDGGDLAISDAQAFERVRQEVMRSTQQRAGANPLGKVYSSVDDLPPAVKNHFKDATKLRQWMHVWNSVYKESGDEQKAFAQAWAQAEKFLTDEEMEKAEAAKQLRLQEFADPGFQKDRKPRFPLRSEAQIRKAWAYMHMPLVVAKYSQNSQAAIRQRIADVWKSKVPGEMPRAGMLEGQQFVEALGENLGKHLYDVGEIAVTILNLDNLKRHLEMEAMMEGDDNDMARMLQENVANLCTFLRALVEEETKEIVEGTEDLSAHNDDGDTPLEMMVRAAVGPNAAHMKKILQEAFGKYEDAEAEAATKRGLKYHKAKGTRLIDALEKAGRRIGQVNRMHLQNAHDHIAAMSDGGVCVGDDDGMEMTGAKLSADTMKKLRSIHDNMSDLGADCSMGKSALLRSTDPEVAAFEKSVGLGEGSLEKIVEQNQALTKALGRVTDTVKTLTERIHKLEKEPEPPRGFKKVMPGARVVDKGFDHPVIEYAETETGLRGDSAVDAFSKHLAGLTEEERARELIKISLRNPVVRTLG